MPPVLMQVARSAAEGDRVQDGEAAQSRAACMYTFVLGAGAMPDTGAFEHNGGYIRNDDGGIRGVKPDLPGWYFWWESPYRSWHLFGPYATREDAEFYQEAQYS
jgi:hypothetical protein